jgi:hypothetical protein
MWVSQGQFVLVNVADRHVSTHEARCRKLLAGVSSTGVWVVVKGTAKLGSCNRAVLHVRRQERQQHAVPPIPSRHPMDHASTHKHTRYVKQTLALTWPHVLPSLVLPCPLGCVSPTGWGLGPACMTLLATCLFRHRRHTWRQEQGVGWWGWGGGKGGQLKKTVVKTVTACVHQRQHQAGRDGGGGGG